MGNISVLHNDAATLYAYADYLKTLGHQVFATTNNYKFILYAGEIPSDMFIIDFDDHFEIKLIEALRKENKIANTPLLLIMSRISLRTKLPPEITSFLLKPLDLLQFQKIINKYTLTNERLKTDSFSPSSHFFYVDKPQKAQDLPLFLD